jgi:PAS domain S-box-containing protein
MAEITSILIIDDTPANLGAMVEALEQQGYRVLVAQDGEEGIERARLMQPDLILLDILMPGIDGFETCRRLKADAGVQEIPVIFMTALSQMSDKVAGFSVGGVDYVTKPFQIDEVLARVATHIKLRALQKQLEAQNTELRHYRDSLEQQVAVRTEEVRLMSHALNRVQEAAYLLDADAAIIYVNEEACRSLGFSAEELMALRVMDIDPYMNAETWAGHWQTVKRDGSAILESAHRRRDGSTFPIEVNTSYFEYGGKAYNLALVRDISERRRAEDALRQLNRALRAISNCNQALVRADDEKVLLNEICRIICEEAGYRMAWVAFAENDDARTVRPVAWAGAEEGYLSLAGLTWADTPEGDRPLGVAIRSGETVITQDLSSEAPPAPWHEQVLRRGYRSAIALPLKDDKAVTFGALCIYSAQVDAFTADEVRLLEELSGDLAFGITALRIRAERARAEAQLVANERRYRMVFENSPVSIWEEDFSEVKAFLDGLHREGVTDIGRYFNQHPQVIRRCAELVRVVDVNKAALALHGTTNKEHLLASLTDTFTPESFRAFGEELACLWNGGTEMVCPAVIKTLAGEPRDVVVYFSVCPGYEESYGRILVSLVDVTERKRAEQELEQQWRRLEDLVATRTRELAEARDAAEAANRAKSIFLANMSHELRTPLNAILGFAQIMATDERIPEDQQRNLTVINHSGQHLLALINDVLEISRIEAGRLRLQPTAFDLTDLMAGIQEVFEARLAEKGLVLRMSVATDLPKFFVTDAGKLRQILMNLLSNAVKFTRQGGVDIDVRIAAGGGKPMLVFTVHDTGVGIAASELEAIFRPFYQTEQGMHASEGTGLGLTIARQYAHLMGGDLTVTSELGKGATFALSLPATFTEAALSSPSMRRVVGLAEDQPSRRVLIVEDAPDNQRLLEQLMQDAGFETRLADNGERALAEFEAWHPDFIWMDMRMPVMDGYEATRRIRALPGGRMTKIAALTASAFQEDRDAIFAAGCDEVLSKPLDEGQLFSTMEKLLNLHFHYADAASHMEPTEAVSLSRLAAEQVDELLRAASQLDVEATMQVIESIRGADAQLADQLTALTQAFRFDRIVAASEQQVRKS